jgi:uncharacterized protein (TIGR02246 family)
MMMKRVCPFLLVLFSASTVLAQGAPQTEDQKAIRTVIENYVKAFNAQDAQKMVSYWAENGDYVDLRGRMIKGRENILAEYDTFFKAFGKPTMTINVSSLDFANENAVIEDGVREVDFPGNQPTREIRYTAVHVKKDGKWLLQSVRDAVVFEDSNYEYLQGLEWMVGDWLDEGEGGVVIQTSCDWSPNQNFLIRSFTTMVRGKETIGGTQWIGWDSEKKAIRSWLFDSDGGYGEGNWVQDGDKWVIESSSVRPNGKVVKETNVITFVDQDKMSLETKNRTLDGKPLPDVKEIVARREATSGKGEEPGVKNAAR